MNSFPFRRILLLAIFFSSLVLAFEALTVSRNYQGNWTALFCTGGKRPIPPSLANGTYVFAESDGYDGQYYRYIAHDLLLNGDEHKYVDDIGFRYKRILVPALAQIFALGNVRAIDTAYIAVILLFVAVGCFWSCALAVTEGYSPPWGGLFLLIPATLISLDRLTIDVAATALTAQFVWYARRDSTPGMWGTITLAVLARETGALLLVAIIAHCLFCSQVRRASLFALAALPAAVWYIYLSFHSVEAASTVPEWLVQVKWGPLWRLFHSVTYPLPETLAHITVALDKVALCGMILLFATASLLLAQLSKSVRQGRVRNIPPEVIAALLFAMLLSVTLNNRFWDSVYSYARPFSPLFLLLLCHKRTRTAALLSLAGVTSRILWQLGPQVLGIVGAEFP